MQGSGLRAKLPRSASVLKVDGSERPFGRKEMRMPVAALRECGVGSREEEKKLAIGQSLQSPTSVC